MIGKGSGLAAETDHWAEGQQGGHEARSRVGGHIPGLDGIRGAAVLMVLMFHGWIIPRETVLQDYLGRLADVGWCGVDLFFVLSGFLITGILHDSKSKGHYFRNFYARRFFRIFPLYYLALVLAFFVAPGFFWVNERVSEDQWWFWLYLSNFWLVENFDLKSTTLSVTWSLAIEEQFYLVWPLVVRLFNRVTMMRFCVVLVLGSLLLRVGLVLGGSEPQVAIHNTFCRLDLLAAGGFLALLLRGPTPSSLIITTAIRAGLIAGGGMLGVFLFHRNFYYGEPGVQTAGFTCLTILFTSLIALTATPTPATPPTPVPGKDFDCCGSRDSGDSEETGDSGGTGGAGGCRWIGIVSRMVRVFDRPGLRLFGRYSYSLYLFHMPLNLYISEHIWGREQIARYCGWPLLGQMIFYGLSISGALGAALLTWNVFEKWFLRLKKYFPSH